MLPRMGAILRSFSKRSAVKCTKLPIDSTLKPLLLYETKYEHSKKVRKGRARAKKYEVKDTGAGSACAAYDVQDRRPSAILCRRVIRRGHLRSNSMGSGEGVACHRARGRQQRTCSGRRFKRTCHPCFW